MSALEAVSAPEPPNGELVAIYWVRSVAGINADGVNSTLPGDFSTFVQVNAIGGVPHVDTFMQATRVQIDGWARDPKGSAKPPWNKASLLLSRIKGALNPTAARRVSLPDAYDDARVHAVVIVTDPRRMPDPDASMAHYMMDVRIYWTPTPKPVVA